MKRIRLLPLIAAAMITAGCGSSKQLTVINVDSEGNPIAAPSGSTVTAEESKAEEQTVSAAESQSSEPAPEKCEFSVENALSALRRISIDSKPTAFGSAAVSQEALNEVISQVYALTSKGRLVSFTLLDLDTMSGISYNTGTKMCVQSVIKSVYIASLVDSSPTLFGERYQEIRDAIAYSDNESYIKLRDEYGTDCLRAWCEEVGVADSITESPYPVMTATEMLKLWVKLYQFFSENETGKKLSVVYETSVGSAGRQLFMDKYKVQTKSGWECGLDTPDFYYDGGASIPAYLTDGDPYNDECACNDAGIVYTENGTYLYVIFSDAPYGVFEEGAIPNPLIDLLSAINDARPAL